MYIHVYVCIVRFSVCSIDFSMNFKIMFVWYIFHEYLNVQIKFGYSNHAFSDSPHNDCMHASIL